MGFGTTRVEIALCLGGCFFLWSVRGKAIEKGGGQRHEVGDGDGDD